MWGLLRRLAAGGGEGSGMEGGEQGGGGGSAGYIWRERGVVLNDFLSRWFAGAAG